LHCISYGPGNRELTLKTAPEAKQTVQDAKPAEKHCQPGVKRPFQSKALMVDEKQAYGDPQDSHAIMVNGLNAPLLLRPFLFEFVSVHIDYGGTGKIINTCYPKPIYWVNKPEITQAARNTWPHSADSAGQVSTGAFSGGPGALPHHKPFRHFAP
jgi:hypothetical protein